MTGTRCPRLLLFIFALLAACADRGDNFEERLTSVLPNQRESRVLEHVRYRGNTVCGKYETLQVNGTSWDTHAFIVTPARVFTRPDAREQAVICSEDPVAAAREEWGYANDSDIDWERLRRVHDDMAAIRDAVVAFHAERVSQPGRLDVLVGGFGVTAAQLVDPWGHPYAYRRGLGGMVTPTPSVTCLGADGRRGGRGVDRDITLSELALLQYLLSARSRVPCAPEHRHRSRWTDPTGVIPPRTPPSTVAVGARIRPARPGETSAAAQRAQPANTRRTAAVRSAGSRGSGRPRGSAP